MWPVRAMKATLTRRGVIAFAIVVCAAIAGAAYAAIPDGGGVIHGCYSTRDGALRVIDPAQASCDRKELPLSWSEQGPTGATGPQGPPGAGAPLDLDELDGLACKGTDPRKASVRVGYGSGLDAPVTLICITHLVGNPGQFTFAGTGGSISSAFLGEIPLPGGSQAGGQIDPDGNVTVPVDLQLGAVPFDGSGDLGGLADVHVTGTIAATATGLAGSLDPGSGDASLHGGLYATVTLDATALILGSTTQIYAGTCELGSASSPLEVTLTTAAPGVSYDQQTGEVTLSAPFTPPSLR